MRIIVTSHGYIGWGGGIDFLRHILNSLLFARNKSENNHILVLPTDDKLCSRDMFSDLSDQVELVFAGPDLRSQFKKAIAAGADVVMPCFSPPDTDLDMPWVGYLYDFQHCCLPEFFTPDERATRDVAFYQMLHRARHVVVNSQTVADDARKFFGNFPAKIHVLPFSPCPQQAWLEYDLDIRKQYGINKQYFVICNQFWRHKDHGSAFKGFAEYIRNGNDALLVCTGETKDYRFPGYFSELQELIKNIGMQDRISILGQIPKMHQISLIKHAMAMVQPTLFEGGPGGGAVYDAISLAIPVICSDIPVNKEIDCGDVRYFEAGNPDHLAQRMIERSGEEIISVSSEQLWQQGVVRKHRCGESLISVAAQTIKDFKINKIVGTPALQGGEVEALAMKYPTFEVQAAQPGSEKKQDRELDRLLALMAEFDRLQVHLRVSEADRAARLEVIEAQGQQLGRIPQLEAEKTQLTAQLQASEADRAARLEVIEAQGQQLGRIPQLEAEKTQLTAQLQASEADRAARLEVIEAQGQQLGRIPQLEAEKAQLVKQMQDSEAVRAGLYANWWVRIGLKLGFISTKSA
jgi:glycosyltransferase involved in cell wall biosynthesis